jgi:iron-sulfur cluster assembly accessory protein
MITLSAEAAVKVREIMERENKLDWKVRMGVRGGGCGGMQYLLGLDSVSREDDQIFEQNGVTLICDSESHALLDGTEIGYESTPDGEGFIIKNPNAQGGCGCGEGEGGCGDGGCSC